MMSLMKRLGGTTKGLPMEQAVKVIKTVVIPQLIYGSEIWWRGTETQQGKKVAWTQSRLGIVNKILRMALRAALPVYKTTPIGTAPGEWNTRRRDPPERGKGQRQPQDRETAGIVPGSPDDEGNNMQTVQPNNWSFQ